MQNAVAGFLDRETERIDALIERKRRLIEFVEEKCCAGGDPIRGLGCSLFDSCGYRRHNQPFALLAEYREALITAAVTGKIDVDTFDSYRDMEEIGT